MIELFWFEDCFRFRERGEDREWERIFFVERVGVLFFVVLCFVFCSFVVYMFFFFVVVNEE